MNDKEASLKSSYRRRVLCVDEDADSREMLSTLLRVSQIEAKAVATAALALSTIQADRFDLYLLEAWLPELDGFELCRLMRAFDRHTPILFYSSAAFEADKKRGIEAGANAYVVKPDVDSLVERIAQFIAPAKSVAVRAARRPLPPWQSTERNSVLRIDPEEHCSFQDLFPGRLN